MPGEAAIEAIHATAVAIDDRALLIRGASHAGKSRLALALIARSVPMLPIKLIGDDRILLHQASGGMTARPHPRIAGFIERRGLGLVAMPWVAQARVGGVVNLEQSTGSGLAPRAPRNDGLAGFPQLAIEGAADTADRVLAWWAALSATWAQHPSRKAFRAPLAGAKD